MCTFYFQFNCQNENADAEMDFLETESFCPLKVVQYELERWSAGFDKMSVDSLLTSS